ncbi:MAG TPA: hypothetical protein VL099_15645 [Candidatus Binatia bacterium]|nr:hypothetical protein [Candidatus Binatia bacterium]
MAQAGAAVRELSPEERAAQDTRKEIAGYKLRLSELQSLLKEIETLARVRRTELRSSGDHLKAAAAWAKHVREIG